MPENATGTFTPVHNVKPDSEEGNWTPPTDLPRSGLDDHLPSTDPEELGRAGTSLEHVANGLDRQDRISAALATILGELDEEVARLNSEGAHLFGQSKYDEAAIRADEGKRLQGFRLKVLNLRTDWFSLGSLPSPASSFISQQRFGGAGNERTPTARKKLSVVFDDGSVIMEDTAAATFAKCISKIGAEKVRALDLRFSGRPLLLDQPGKDRWPVDGYFFDTRTTAEQKCSLLRSISDRTGVRLEAITK